MSKKHFIELADAVRGIGLTAPQLDALATFCKQQNHRFMPQRWLAYVRG